MKGRSIEERPAIVNEGSKIGQWEGDSVVGQREGYEAVTFTAVEKVTCNYIAGRNRAAVETAMAELHMRPEGAIGLGQLENRDIITVWERYSWIRLSTWYRIL